MQNYNELMQSLKDHYFYKKGHGEIQKIIDDPVEAAAIATAAVTGLICMTGHAPKALTTIFAAVGTYAAVKTGYSWAEEMIPLAGADTSTTQEHDEV